MPDNKSSLKQDLIKILVDKLLIGILLVIIGIFSTNFIEKLKSERSFSAELDKIRAEKIGEVWEKVYIYEAASEAASEAARKEIIREGEKLMERLSNEREHPSPTTTPKDLKEEVEETRREIEMVETPVSKEGHELSTTLNKNRFWLGEDMYQQIEHYFDASREYHLALASKDENKINDAAKKREESRATITKIRDRLLKE